uniref:(northern house mosquito) hypothetical protein n=1 Tax=Culex pipiens TaxID=7175 RepID=A0A8D8A9M8_CULPI
MIYVSSRESGDTKKPDIFARQRATPGHSCVSHQPTSRTINFPPGAQPATTTTTGKEQTLPRGVEHGYSIKAELLNWVPGGRLDWVGLDRPRQRGGIGEGSWVCVVVFFLRALVGTSS